MIYTTSGLQTSIQSIFSNAGSVTSSVAGSVTSSAAAVATGAA
ncbi:hypothetical protein [Dialister hominis]